MTRPWKDEHPVRLTFLAATLSLAYLAILVPSGFLQAARLRSYDSYCRWRSALTPPPKEASDLLLVTVDEESQRQLGRKWPWDRSVFAEFITKVSADKPSLIVLDFVLSGASEPEQDNALAEAIKKGPPVLLASYLDRHGDPVLPHPLFVEAGGVPGLINHPRDIDLTVRSLFAGLRLPMRPEPLFATELNAAVLHNRLTLSDLQLEFRHCQVLMGKKEIPLDPPIGCMSINYLVRPSQISTVSFWQVMQGKVPPEKIGGKIVLVGSTREITHDIYPTPLGLMPGVVISGNGILTALSGEFLRSLPLLPTLFLGFLLMLVILLATYWLPLHWGALTAGFLTAAGVTLGFLCLLAFNYKAESLSVYLLAGTAWFTGILYKYALLFTHSLRLQKQVLTDPLTGAVTERYFRLRLQAGWPHVGKQNPASLLIVQMDPIPQQLDQASWAEVQKRLQTLVEAISQHFKKRGTLIGRLKEDRLGVFAPGMDLEQAKKAAETLRESLQPVPGHLAFGLCEIRQTLFTSAAHGILSAESAAARSWNGGNRQVEVYHPAIDKALAPADAGGDSDASDSIGYVASELEDRNRSIEKALADLRVAHQELQNHFLEVTKSLVMAMDTKDAYTAGHLERVSRYATRLAEVVGLPKEEIEAIREAALLHDIGKLNLPEEVLHKTGQLTQEEAEIIRKHLELGAKILDPMKFFRPITAILYHHHERYDGKGYPHGLTGEFIPAGAQVISVVDSFDAMTTNRGYNKPKTVQEALEELHRGAGTQFHPTYVEAFIKLIQSEGQQLAGYAAHHTP